MKNVAMKTATNVNDNEYTDKNTSTVYHTIYIAVLYVTISFYKFRSLD